MQSLFSQESSLRHVGVLYNDEPYLGSIEELFDPEFFDTIQICTFVSSPKYFFKQTTKYQNIELLLGIEDTTNAEKFMLDTQYTSSFFGSLNKETLSKIASGAISVRFTKTGTIIHSKIYIQTNTQSSQYRVMIGSANYSYKAFGGQKQFEELLVYDSSYNEKMTSYFLKRYELIKENTLDFVPEHIKKRIASEELKILTLSNEESLDILKSRMDDVQTAMICDLYYMKFAGFKEDKKNNVILLDDEIVFGTKMSVNRDKQELLQYLPIGILIEQKGIVKLNYEKFFEFIGTKSKNQSFFKKIF